MSLLATYEGMDLTTPELVREFMGTGPSSSTSTLEAMVTAVSRRILQVIGRHGPRKERTESYQRVPRRGILRLDGAPIDIAAPFTITVGSTVIPTAEPLGVDGYVLDYARGTVTIHSSPTRGPSYAQVVYTAGLAISTEALASGNEFQDLVQAATMQVRHQFERRDKLGGDVKVSFGQGGIVATERRGQYRLLEEVVEGIQHYVRGGV